VRGVIWARGRTHDLAKGKGHHLPDGGGGSTPLAKKSRISKDLGNGSGHPKGSACIGSSASREVTGGSTSPVKEQVTSRGSRILLGGTTVVDHSDWKSAHTYNEHRGGPDNICGRTELKST